MIMMIMSIIIIMLNKLYDSGLKINKIFFKRTDASQLVQKEKNLMRVTLNYHNKTAGCRRLQP